MIIDTWEIQYLDILRELVDLAETYGADADRTGTGRIRLFCRDIKIDLSEGILPVVTTRRVPTTHGIHELLWMISGSSNIKDLHDSTRRIWKEWAIEEEHVNAFCDKFFKGAEEEALNNLKSSLLKKHVGSIGPMYGKFWRNNPSTETTLLYPYESLLFEDIPSDKRQRYKEEYDEIIFFAKQANPGKTLEEIEGLPDLEDYSKREYFETNDQLGEIVRGIKRRPYSARHVMSAWIPQYCPFENVYSPHENVLIGRGSLTACHLLTQFFVEKSRDGGPNFLNLKMTQRSCDTVLGVPTNIVFYSTLLHLMAHVTDLRPKTFIWSGVDVHIYSNHIEGVTEQLQRVPLPPPKIKINPNAKDLFSMTIEDIEVIGYNHAGVLKFDIYV